MPHPNLEPRMSTGPRPWARLDRSGAHYDEEGPPSAAEGHHGRWPSIDRRWAEREWGITSADFLRGVDPTDYHIDPTDDHHPF